MPSARRGEPETETGSLNSTAMPTTRFAPYTPSGTEDSTPCTRGAALSMVMLFSAPSEAGDPGNGRLVFAGLPALSARPPPASSAPVPA